MSDRIQIFDTTLRDGEQTAGVAFSAEQKREIAGALSSLGVDVVEAGFPVNSAEEFAAVRGVAETVRDTRICALARAVPRDVEAAGEALRDAAAPRIHVFVNARDMQLARQLGKTRESVTGMAAAMVERARDFTDDVEFSPMDATRADPAFLVTLLRAATAAGARTLNLPDTVGVARPGQVAALVRRVVREVCDESAAETAVSFHGQDDLGLATANALAAVEAGARQLEVAVNGLGERSGNTSFEEVAVALRIHGEAWNVHTGVDTTGICDLSRRVAEASGVAVAVNKAVVGANAFRHASGIHQDGVLKERATYEAYDPAWIGHATGTEIVLGKLSGRAGFAARAADLGHALEGRALQRAFERFQVEAAATSGAVPDRVIAKICRGDSSPARSVTLRHVEEGA
ncbi:MAG: homocitrate synthase/isopropylmalate synthase family protein [Myxococcota bacterium]